MTLMNNDYLVCLLYQASYHKQYNLYQMILEQFHPSMYKYYVFDEGFGKSEMIEYSMYVYWDTRIQYQSLETYLKDALPPPKYIDKEL